jgi:hypothetical protein
VADFCLFFDFSASGFRRTGADAKAANFATDAVFLAACKDEQRDCSISVCDVATKNNCYHRCAQQQLPKVMP